MDSEGESPAQDVLLRAAVSTAGCELAIHNNDGEAANFILLRLRSDLCLVHVVDDYLMRIRDVLYHLDRFIADRATCAEDFNLFFAHIM